jgi:mono/diheme cytochrome c family protein
MWPRASVRTLLAVLILAARAADAAPQQTGPAPAARDGVALYAEACAACHGADGRGASREVVGFDTPLPDFTDCSFSTPETTVDWFAIVHQGGPVRAFDRRMPAFSPALTDADIELTVAHAQSFCSAVDWPRGELNLPRALVTEKAYPENEALLTWRFDRERVSQQVLYERRVGPRSQFEIAIPVDARASVNGWRYGLGDTAVAVKHVLAHSLDAGGILSVAAEVILPTGKETEGLGKGFTVVEPFVAVGQLLPHDGFVQAQAGVEFPTRSSANNEAFWRVAIGRTYVERRFGRSWSPAIELIGAREFEFGAPTLWDVVPQVQVSLSRRQHILLSAGVQLPVNARRRSTQVLGYVLWDWFDGGLFDGWR